MLDFRCDIIKSKDLGMTRITEARYENPDCSDIVIDKDLVNKAFTKKVIAGPIQDLYAGINKIKVFTRKL